MLHQITWQQYLLFVAGILLLYYGTIWLVFFRQSSGNLFPKNNFPVPDHDGQNSSGDLMGQSMKEYGVSTLDSDELHFGPNTPEDETSAFPDDESLNGLIPDVLEEIKNVIHTIETEEGDKDDFKSLFKLVSAKYPQIKNSRHLEAINEWVTENAPFNLSEDELNELWK